MDHYRGLTLRSILLPALACVLALGACGPRVAVVETARSEAREADSEVLVFVRDTDGIPPCPWEILGTIEVEPGWMADEGERSRTLRSAARLGGHAVMVDAADDREARVLRFFDPLCNPLKG